MGASRFSDSLMISIDESNSLCWRFFVTLLGVDSDVSRGISSEEGHFLGLASSTQNLLSRDDEEMRPRHLPKRVVAMSTTLFLRRQGQS
jgi:hypothetical protein